MWILILTILASTSTSQSGQSVTGISGFQSKESCMSAAQAWLNQTHPAARRQRRRHACRPDRMGQEHRRRSADPRRAGPALGTRPRPVQAGLVLEQRDPPQRIRLGLVSVLRLRPPVLRQQDQRVARPSRPQIAHLIFSHSTTSRGKP